ncbi:MAG: membrane integrity-associated transporter subunit PqiC [Uliginosibacterium sp.]|nr:membrane integrity-associated transporter subunit PqiC [Uliginosibacterium sp.]MBK9616385.1 membrane integrity-associated transporter subunit PqiC [Uliginosibacterium sp.]
MSGLKRRRVWVLAGLLGLLGCASPPSRFHTLDAVAERVAQPERPTTILVAQVGIPPRVDRRQLVLGVGRVTIEEFERWAAPLRDEIGRALALNLSRQLGASQVAAWPQNLIADPDLQVFADFARFESQPGVVALCEVRWRVRDRQGKTLASGSRTYETQPEDARLTSLTMAHNRNLAALGADIAAALRAP